MAWVKVKKLFPFSELPQKSTAGAAGWDLVATTITTCHSGVGGLAVVTVGSGLAFEIPQGYCLKLYPRSSVVKKFMQLSNGVGIIDSDYRGEVMAKFYIPEEIAMDFPKYGYKFGERFAQLILEKVENVIFEEVEELSETERGAGGYGSTGK